MLKIKIYKTCVFCNKYTEHEAWKEKSTNPHSGNFGELVWHYSCIKCNGLRPIPPKSKEYLKKIR
jgi:hypothetical protein